MSLRTRILVHARTMPAMSSTIVKLSRMINDPEADIEEVANTLQLDPGVTANVLKLANSAALGLPRKVGSVKEAVVRIGLKQLYHIVVSSSIKPMVDKPLDGYELDEGLYWRHSIAVATASEILATTCRKIEKNAFTGGILHDIGKQIVSRFIQQNNESFYKEEEGDETFDTVEQNLLGIDHSELGATLMERWQFPSSLINAVRFHHQPDLAQEDQVLVDLVHVGDAICSSGGLGIGRDGLQYEISNGAMERLGLIDETMDDVLCKTMEKTEEFEELLKTV